MLLDSLLLVDRRNDAQIISDILRVWSQILTPAKQVVWNDMAQRDLSKAVLLPSGLRLNKSFIEKDIKSFQNLKIQERKQIIKKVNKCTFYTFSY